MTLFKSVCCLFIASLQYLPILAYCGERMDDAEQFDCVIEPRTTVDIGSPAEGILVDVLVERGDEVGKGLPLANLDSTLEEISADLARLKAANRTELDSRRAQLDYRTKEVHRLEPMREKRTASEKSFDQAEIERRLAKLSLESAKIDQRLAAVEYRRAQALLERRTIRSPVDGVVVDVLMSRGEYVHEQSQLMQIAELDPLHVEVYLPVSRYELVKKGMTASIHPEEPVGGEYQANVIVVDNVFDPASRTFGVRLELENPDYKLPAGLRCTLSFHPASGPQ